MNDGQKSPFLKLWQS